MESVCGALGCGWQVCGRVGCVVLLTVEVEIGDGSSAKDNRICSDHQCGFCLGVSSLNEVCRACPPRLLHAEFVSARYKRREAFETAAP